MVECSLKGCSAQAAARANEPQPDCCLLANCSTIINVGMQLLKCIKWNGISRCEPLTPMGNSLSVGYSQIQK
jgi:hypothetical protein